MNKRILILFFLLQTVLCRAQQYPMLHYTQENGLPSDNVYRIFQDTDGMLWFATDKGVSRYNGLKFENFTTADGLPDNDIFYFLKDHEGRLWMAAYNGELVYYKDGVFHTAANTPFLKKNEKSTNPRQMTLEADSSIVIIYGLGLKGLMIKKNKVQEIPLHSGMKLSPSYLVKKSDGTLALTYYAGFNVYFEATMNMQSKVLKQERKTYTFFPISFPDCYIENRKLYDLNGKFLSIVPDSFSIANILNAICYRSGHLLLCTNYGLWIDSSLVLKKHRVASAIQDREGNFWIATLTNGVYKISGHFDNSFFSADKYTGTVMTSIQQRDIVYGTSDMNLYFLSDTGIRCFFNYSNVYQKAAKAAAYTLLPFKDNYFVLAPEEYLQVNAKHNTKPVTIHTNHSPDIIPKNGILLTDTQLYLNVMQDVVLVHPDRLFKESVFKNRLRADSNSRIYQMQQAPDSSIWFSNEYLSRIKGKTFIQQHQLGKTSFRQIIFSKDFLAGIDMTNHLVLIRHYNSQKPVKDTIDQNCVWNKFFKLTDSSILVSTNDYYRVITFGCNNRQGYRTDILEYPFIPQLAEWVHSDGRKCYFFRKGNVWGIPVSALLQAPALPELRFTHVNAGDQKHFADSGLSFAYRDSRSLSVQYDVISFNTDLIQVEYSISSASEPDKWINAGNNGSIELFNISQGYYTVKIRARTFGGRYSVVKTLQLHISAPFWLRWWFIALVIVLTALIVFVIVRLFIRRRLAFKEKENKFLRSEFTALNALMNPHFVFNSLNSVQSLINKEDLEAANQYVRTISDLLRQNMHNISRELIPLKREMDLIDNYMKLEKLRFKERLQYTISMAEEVEEDFVLVPPLLVQPLVENAIKYTLAFSQIGTGVISIDIYTSEEKVFIDVTDNGRGLNASKAQKKPGHESTALGNIKSRLEQLSLIHGKAYLLEIEELKDERGHISGTRARISIEL